MKKCFHITMFFFCIFKCGDLVAQNATLISKLSSIRGVSSYLDNTIMGGQVFSPATNLSYKNGLIKTDGTNSTFYDIPSTPNGSGVSGNLVTYKNKVYMKYTTQTAQMIPFPPYVGLPEKNMLAKFDGTSISIVPNPSNGLEMWYYDGPIVIGDNMYLAYLESPTRRVSLGKFNGDSLQVIPSHTDFSEVNSRPFEYKNKLHVLFMDKNTFKVRIAMYDSATGYSTYANPNSGGFHTNHSAFGRPIVYNGNLYCNYFFNNKTQLGKFDGSTVTTIANPDNGSGINSPLYSLGGYLYFLYTDSLGRSNLARFDGNSISLFNTPQNTTLLSQSEIIQYKSNIYLVGVNNGKNWLYQFNGSTVSKIVNSDTTSTGLVSWKNNVCMLDGNMYFPYIINSNKSILAKFDGNVLSLLPPADTSNVSTLGWGRIINGKMVYSYYNSDNASFVVYTSPCVPTISTTNKSYCQSELPITWNGLTIAAAGTYTVRLTNAAGCDSTATLVATLKAGPLATVNYLTGVNVTTMGMCNIGDSIQIANYTAPGGVWTSSNPGVASVVPTASYNRVAKVKATGVGTVTITYGGITSSGGCPSTINMQVTVMPITTPAAIIGSGTACLNTATSFSNATSGGVWSVSRGTITTNGDYTPTSVGTGVITYTLSNVAGCSKSVSKSVTINTQPAIPTISFATGTTGITGTGGYCTNRTFTLVGTPTGGVWSKTGVINITSGGVVTTTSLTGAASVIFTVTNAFGCSNSRSISTNIVACSPRGINNLQSTTNNFTVYPNPTRTTINLNINKLVGVGSIVVTDLYGKQIKQQPLSMGANTIDVSSFAKGMYLVSIITENGKQVQKIVVE